MVLAKNDSDIILVDEMGKAWPCHLIFPRGPNSSEVRLRGWSLCRQANGYVEGLSLKLEVPIEQNSTFLLLNRC